MQQETLAQIIRRTVREFEQQELETKQQQAITASAQTARHRRKHKTSQLASSTSSSGEC